MPRPAPPGQQGTEQPPLLLGGDASAQESAHLAGAYPHAGGRCGVVGAGHGALDVSACVPLRVPAVEQENGQRRIAYRDTTGETAVRNVMRDAG